MKKQNEHTEEPISKEDFFKSMDSWKKGIDLAEEEDD